MNFALFVLMVAFHIIRAIYEEERKYKKGESFGKRSVTPSPTITKVTIDTERWLEEKGFVGGLAKAKKEGYAENSIEWMLCDVYQQLEEIWEKDADFFMYYFRPILKHPVLIHHYKGMWKNNHFRFQLRALYALQEKHAVRNIADWELKTNKANTPTNFNMYNDLLIQYLYEQYPTPPFLWKTWPTLLSVNASLTGVCDAEDLQNPERHPLIRLYLHITAGGSFRDIEQTGFRLEVSRKMAHFLKEEKETLSFPIAYIKAVALAEGLSPQLANVLGYANLQIDDVNFWRPFFQFVRSQNLGPNQEQSLREVAIYMNMIRFKSSELSKDNKIGQLFDFKGRSWNTFVKDLYNAINMDYPAMGNTKDAYLLEGEDGKWYRFVRLRNHKALKEEGEVMEHCVSEFQFHQDCLSGASHIWSMRMLHAMEEPKEERIATIQFYQNALDEVMGPKNRCLSEDHWKLVNQWTSKHLRLQEMVAN
ncbi:MAG: hypothetical protein MRY78_10790 [Saprospiraceae bacterium]|nr:hypothetical protein [Saprospiraceae bacterium]